MALPDQARRFPAVVLLAAWAFMPVASSGGGLDGRWEWLEDRAPKSTDPKSTVPGKPRTLTDRTDTVTGSQLHAIYVLPSDGADEALDTNGAIATSVLSFNRWLGEATGGRTLRLDLFEGQPDVSFFRLARTDAQMKATDPNIRTELEKDLKAAGRIQPGKLYAVYYGGTSAYACGGGAWPPALVGQVGAMYLKGAVPGFPACNTNPLGASLETPGYMEFAMLHELMHTLGFVATCAPHHTLAGHVSDSPNDLMWSGNQPWQLPPKLDIGGDDYYRHATAGCADFFESPYLLHKSLTSHYYQSILRRTPDAGGQAFWDGEADRVRVLGANVNETWFALASAFFNSGEYLAFNRDASGYVQDLYATFFNRAADGPGLSYWTGLMGSGMPREVVLVSFMFSAEFVSFTRNLFGNTAVRAEIDTVVDFYRGILGRLPDSGGFNHWVGQFRTAQCQGSAAVYTQVEAISSAYVGSPEYAARNRSNSQFVGDMYNAFLRRGGDLGGVQFWIDQLNTGARTREQVRQAFLGSPEFGARVQAIVAQGCAP